MAVVLTGPSSFKNGAMIMVELPEVNDQTLMAVDMAMEKNQWVSSGNIGIPMGNLGHECDRALWYDFRWVITKNFDAASLKRFEDGYAGEDLMAKRLRMVDGVTLITQDPETGKQTKVTPLGGHMTGKLDGEIVGLLQALKTWHIWEHKVTAQTKVNKLKKLKQKLGEKSALSEWNFRYYVQGQMYMRYRGLTRHYMTVSTPGGRETISVRTDYDEFFAAQQEARAKRVIFSATPPDRLGEDPDFFTCKMCDHKDHCHKIPGSPPLRRNCRTCLHSTPLEEGGWFCEKHQDPLDYKAQQAACCDHRFIPSLVFGEQIDADENGNWVAYVLPDGSTWIDGEVG